MRKECEISIEIGAKILRVVYKTPFGASTTMRVDEIYCEPCGKLYLESEVR